ncbi:MAG: hypothetical protein JSU96_10040 [Acidobacteriota bacterium]|nr:MAG: hypothetical protein JSU96_10040 [Acidobacteriota bacterium]
MKLKRYFFLVLTYLLVLGFAEAAPGQWLHVRVVENGDVAVKVNVPLSMVSALMPMVEDKHFQGGKVRLDTHEMTVAEMRELWNALRAGGDYEVITVEDGENTVRVSLEGSTLFIRSSEAAKASVLVQVPGAVVDALLSGEGDELDVNAAVQALSETGGGDLVKVQDEGTSVHVWIDSQTSPAE